MPSGNSNLSQAISAVISTGKKVTFDNVYPHYVAVADFARIPIDMSRIVSPDNPHPKNPMSHMSILMEQLHFFERALDKSPECTSLNGMGPTRTLAITAAPHDTDSDAGSPDPLLSLIQNIRDEYWYMRYMEWGPGYGWQDVIEKTNLKNDLIQILRCDGCRNTLFLGRHAGLLGNCPEQIVALTKRVRKSMKTAARSEKKARLEIQAKEKEEKEKRKKRKLYIWSLVVQNPHSSTVKAKKRSRTLRTIKGAKIAFDPYAPSSSSM